MRDAPCGQLDCPIVDPERIDRRSLRTHVLPAGSEWFRVSRAVHGNQPFTPPHTGNGRFSPLGERGHTYIAEQRTASLLESALHEAAGPNPRIYSSVLRNFVLTRLRLSTPAKLVDLRDSALADLGIERDALTGADAQHYPCTRLVAERVAGAKSSVGLVWTSRQGVLHAERNPDGLASEVLRHDSLDVAVLYSPDVVGRVDVLSVEQLVVDDAPTRFIVELANLLRIAVL